MKIQPRNIDAFVKKPAPDMLAVLVYGPDEGLVRERVNIMAATVADPKDPFATVEISGAQLLDDPGRLLDEAKSISLMGGRRVVKLRDALDKNSGALKELLAALKSGDNFVLVAAGELGPRSDLRLTFENAENAAAVPCYVDDERDISRVLSSGLKEAGFSISSDALNLLAANVVGDRAVARGEIEKLVTYMGKESRNISLDDVSACVGAGASLPLENLARHVASGQFAEAERVLALSLSEGTNAVAILRALQNYFLRLHITKARLQKGEGLESATAKLRPPLFFKHKSAFESQVAALSARQMEQALTLIASAEARCKQTGSLPELIVGRAVLSLCQLAKAASKRRA